MMLLDHTPHPFAEPRYGYASAAARARGRLTIDHDPAGTITVTSGADQLTPEDIDLHFDHLGIAIERERSAGRPVRVLVDLRAAPPQSDETIARLDLRIRTTYRPGDRVAIVVASCLAKIQLREVVRSNENAFFVSMDAARMWLHAFDRASG